MLSWIDICAGLAAKSVAGGPCVTASVDSVHFLSPCHLGSVCIVAAMVNRTFQSSMEVCCCMCMGRAGPTFASLGLPCMPTYTTETQKASTIVVYIIISTLTLSALHCSEV